MYFSVIRPEENFLRDAVREIAQSSYADHQWLWRFFPSSEDQVRDFIYRRDTVEQIPRFYVVSKRKPLSFSEAWNIQSREYNPQLQAGQHLSFQLFANPVITKKNGAGKSQRHDVVMEAKKQLLAKYGSRPNMKWSEWSDEGKKPLLYEVVYERCAIWLEGVSKRNGFELSTARLNSQERKLQVEAYDKNKAGKRDEIFNLVPSIFQAN